MDDYLWFSLGGREKEAQQVQVVPYEGTVGVTLIYIPLTPHKFNNDLIIVEQKL